MKKLAPIDIIKPIIINIGVNSSVKLWTRVEFLPILPVR